MVTTPPPTWIIEPTLRYMVSYFPTNALNQAPSYVDDIQYDYNSAIARAKALIIAATNIGVCCVTPVVSQIVYPPIAWDPNAPN